MTQTITRPEVETSSLSSEMQARLLAHAAKPGVHVVDVYDLDCEFVGGLGDCDTSVGTVSGEFDPDELRRLLPNGFTVNDYRGANG